MKASIDDKYMYLLRYLIGSFLVVTSSGFAQAQQHPLWSKVICVDAGHGGTAATDSYRKGPSGEREEWINLRVAGYLRDMLEARGAKVIMTRNEDEFIPLAKRAELARDNQADVFLSIHHNATADSSVNFPIIYFHGHVSENEAGVALGKALSKAFLKHIYIGEVPVSLVSDQTIFAGSGAAVLRGTYGIPAVLAEASFFSNPTEEQRLKDTVYNRREAEAYLEALTEFFTKETMAPIRDKNSLVDSLSPFRGLQEADRMSPMAKTWYKDYQEGLRLMNGTDSLTWQKAYESFTRSARSFPDSYVARVCHKNRAILMRKLGRDDEANEEALRAREYYTLGFIDN
ncbi:N-acetylmuramoyl-L-alanine amidase family protein [Olivibacter sitiensis]|uniref:N-acetylmuramoyl-L-alanine amidase family protein n=1 Tax=Olivibacter sitiensis TaxID=376470 RepID=UPI0004137724|nr:N-acetylmuramoyl-L-alanine amidase [Olivibacter sitiensis]